VLSKTGGVLGTLASALKSPISIGTGVGALGGAGAGYFASDPDDPNRLRNALAGGVMGAGVGGLTGALVHSGGQAEEEVASMVDKGFQLGEEHGHAQGLKDVASNPELAVKVLEQMSPDSRKLVMRSFDKGWLTRMFGG